MQQRTRHVGKNKTKTAGLKIVQEALSQTQASSLSVSFSALKMVCVRI